MRLMSRHDGVASSHTLWAMVAQAEDSLDRAGALIRLSRTGLTGGEDVRLDECLAEMGTLFRYVTGPHVRVRLLATLISPSS